MLQGVLRLIALKVLTSQLQIESNSVCFDDDAVVLTLQFCCHDVNVDDDSLLKDDDDVKAVVYAKIENLVGYRHLTRIYEERVDSLKRDFVDARKMILYCIDLTEDLFHFHIPRIKKIFSNLILVKCNLLSHFYKQLKTKLKHTL